MVLMILLFVGNMGVSHPLAGSKIQGFRPNIKKSLLLAAHNSTMRRLRRKYWALKLLLL